MSHIFEQMPRIVPMREAFARPLNEAALADNHAVIAPTHVVLRGDKIVGYGSVGGMPMMVLWVKSGEVKARESMHLLATGEAIAASLGMKQICVPVVPKSPFYELMPQLGYTQLGEARFNVKVVI